MKRVIASLAGIVFTIVAGVFVYTAPPAGAVANNGKVLVIILENHTYSQMVSSMPYLKGQSDLHTYFDNYDAITHPSEPNYLDIAFGSNMGSTSDHNPAYQTAGQSVFGQALAATFSDGSHGTAATYEEDMQSNCAQTNSTLQVAGAAAYAPKHNPWASASDERGQCNFADVPSGTYQSGKLRDDVLAGNLPNVGLLVPNQCNDAHQSTCGLSAADTWLSHWLPVIMNGPDYTSGKLAIVVTADEGNSTDNSVLTSVIAKATEGDGINHTALNHYSLSGFLSDTTGSPHLRNAAGAPNMRAALGFPAPK